MGVPRKNFRVTLGGVGARLRQNGRFEEHRRMTKRPSTPPDDGDAAQPSPDHQAIFGESLRRQRTKAGLTQADLAARSGINQETISRIENGRYNLTLKTMGRLAALLDGDVSEMLKKIENSE